MNILNELRARFARVLVDFTDEPWLFAAMVRPSQDRRFGDFQANCAMPLAKRSGLNPRELALRIADRLDLADLCDPAEIAGPGFINLTLRNDRLEQQINNVVADERLGVDAATDAKQIVLDFSSPNVAKPMHVGHLRATVIGDALQRVLRFLGHRVTSDNHIGDWGTQFGMIIYGYKHFVDSAAYERDPVGELARLYRLVNRLSEYHIAKETLPEREGELSRLRRELEQAETVSPPDKKAKKVLKKLRGAVESTREQITSLNGRIAGVEEDSKLADLAQHHQDIVRATRDETAKLHTGDAENRGLWNQFLPQCLAALRQIYDRLDIKFDLTLGESAYDSQLPGVVEDLEQRDLAVESDGAKCVFVAGNDAPFIIQKADGAYTYATTDLATISYRVRELQADLILYVVDARQAEHFKLLFETARKWGFAEVGLRHVSFGTVMGQDRRPYRTRSGDTVGLESLLDEAVSRAREIVADNDDGKRDGPELDEEDRDRIAEIVGIGGIKYADLHHNRESDYVFDWGKMLATTGDTATYMQYAYARIHGIFRKGDVCLSELQESPQSILLRDPEEPRFGPQTVPVRRSPGIGRHWSFVRIS